MAMLPVRRDPAPLAVRAATLRARAVIAADDEPADTPVRNPLTTRSDTVATPEDRRLARQQAAFDRLAAQLAERQREANVIRDLAMEQLKRDEEVLKKWIEMI